jgi:hypothetical protein
VLHQSIQTFSSKILTGNTSFENISLTSFCFRIPNLAGYLGFIFVRNVNFKIGVNDNY